MHEKRKNKFGFKIRFLPANEKVNFELPQNRVPPCILEIHFLPTPRQAISKKPFSPPKKKIWEGCHYANTDDNFISHVTACLYISKSYKIIDKYLSMNPKKTKKCKRKKIPTKHQSYITSFCINATMKKHFSTTFK